MRPRKARANPAVVRRLRSDASDETLRSVRDFLLAAVDKTPSTPRSLSEQIVQAAYRTRDFRTLNRMLAAFTSRDLPANWTLAEAPEAAPRAAPKSRRDDRTFSQTDYERLTQSARQAVNATVRRSLGAKEREELTHATIVTALEKTGGQPGRVTREMLIDAAEDAELRWISAFDKERPGVESIAQKLGTAPEHERAEQLREDGSTGRDAVRDRVLRPMLRTGSPEQRFGAAILLLHLGLPGVYPGQPQSFSKRVRSPDPGRPNITAGERDFGLYHPGGARGGTVCPSCKQIYRFVRLPGLTPQQVSTVVDSFAVELQRLSRL